MPNIHGMGCPGMSRGGDGLHEMSSDDEYQRFKDRKMLKNQHALGE